MTIDHDAIEPRVRLNRACREPGPCPDLEAAYLDLYDEVKRLRADLRHVIDERDATFALMLARAEKAEAERDRVAAEWAETSQRNYQRAKAAEAERDALRAALEICPPTSNPTLSAEYHVERINAWWRSYVRPALALTKGQTND